MASLVPKGSKVADIGSDHAYLSINLVKNGIVRAAIASEVAAGPLANSRDEIKKNKMTEQIEARLGDGLASIEEDDNVDVICIAGMGGLLIRKILDEGQSKLQNVKRLVLQPNVGEYELREWLIRHNFKITVEDIVAEDFHLYEIIVAEPGEMNLDESQLTFGPKLIQEHNEVFMRKWNRELKRLKNIQTSLNVHPQSGVEKLKRTTSQIELIEEMLKNVSKAIN